MLCRDADTTDIPELLSIETLSFESAWTEKDFLFCFRQSDYRRIVATMTPGSIIIGFVIYDCHSRRARIINFAVRPDCRRRGVGRTMVNSVVSEMSSRTPIKVLLRETNLPAQLFFRDCGFAATSIVRGNYRDSDEDAYDFVHGLSAESTFEDNRLI
jgi:ribosomal-protein-alanine N-acetyltransferase